ncbi:ABC transporter permease [Aeromicrobium sp. Sec7.5]|uniref:ABC transporter permease n=1 Tax=Aeromicrobium sp. Sec7.5 TaxID=3121276 RepID=UPI002FE4B38F
MTAALVAEFRKFFSTRLWWILALAMVVYLAFIAGVFGFSLTVDTGSDTQPSSFLSPKEIAQSIYALTSPIGYVFPLIIGSLAVTSEFRHQTVTGSLLVEPRRTLFVVAKLVSSIPMGLAYGVLATATVVAAGAPVLALAGDGAFLGDSEVIETLVLSIVVMALWTMMGVAFGTVLTNQVAAIVVVLAFTQLIEPIARVALGAFDATSEVSKYLPGAAADALLGSSFFSSFGGGGGVDLLPQWGGAVVMVAYIVVLAVVGRLTTFRRDIG